MNLNQAQLGDARGINLGGYVPAAVMRPPTLLQQALAAVASSAGSAVANNAVQGLMTPDMGKAAVQQDVQMPGLERDAETGALEDKRNALQRWFMPNTQKDFAVAQSNKQQGDYQTASLANQAQGLEQSGKYQDASIANQAQGLKNEMSIADSNAELKRQGLVIDKQNSDQSGMLSRAQAERLGAQTFADKEKLPLELSALGLQNETTRATQPSVIANAKLSPVLTQSGINQNNAAARSANASAAFSEATSAPMIENAKQAKINVKLQQLGIPADGPIGNTMRMYLEGVNLDDKTAVQGAVATAKADITSKLNGGAGSSPAASATPTGFQGLPTLVKSVASNVATPVNDIATSFSLFPDWLMGGQAGVTKGLQNNELTYPTTPEGKLAKQKALQDWIAAQKNN